MKLSEWLLIGVLGWSAIGTAGIAISLLRGRRIEAKRHAAWLAGVIAVYCVALLVVSATQPQKFIPVGKAQCFSGMCFAVIAAEDIPAHLSGTTDRTLRVSIRVSNHGHSAQSESLIRAYLVDSEGRSYLPLSGLSGNLLTARVGPGSQVISQPLFRVPADSTGLGLIFTLGHWQFGRLVLGDPDSIGHKPAVNLLGESARNQ